MRSLLVIQSAIDALTREMDMLHAEAAEFAKIGKIRRAVESEGEADDLSLARDALLWATGETPDCREFLRPFLGESCDEPSPGQPRRESQN
jgi:hypothetical protein